MITINGNNPAEINVGDTYSDIGATVTDNVDHNLGIKASVDGGPEVTMDQIAIDTSVAGTHTITYSATDSADNTGTATRTVEVVAPAASDTSATTSDTTTTSADSTSTP
jgi:hypothetical protein